MLNALPQQELTDTKLSQGNDGADAGKRTAQTCIRYVLGKDFFTQHVVMTKVFSYRICRVSGSSYASMHDLMMLDGGCCSSI